MLAFNDDSAIIVNPRRKKHLVRGDGGTGRHDSLRGCWGNPWGFKSPSPHHTSQSRRNREGASYGRPGNVLCLHIAKSKISIAFSSKDKAFSFEKYLKVGSGKAFLNKRLISSIP